MSPEAQGRAALVIVALAAAAVAGHYLRRRVLGAVARTLLARGQVKWAMRLRKLSGDRSCC